MAYRRRYRHSVRRAKPRTAWQSYVKSVKTSAIDNTKGLDAVLDYFYPGVGRNGATDFHQFEQEVLLETIRGQLAHEGEVSGSTVDNWFPVSLAFVRVPAEFASTYDNSTDITATDLWNNLEGDDYFLRYDCLCNPSSTPPTEVEHVNAKSKRRFRVGDAISVLASMLSPVASGEAKVDFTFNLRLLWKFN